MRLVLGFLLVGTAWAEPKADPKPAPKVAPRVLPHVKGMAEAQRGVELTPSIEYRDDVAKTPSFGGGTSLGRIDKPAWHTDMRDYADGGMVIRPPGTADDMAIAPGTDWLVSRTPAQRLWNLLRYGADRLFETLIPSAGKT